MLGLSLVKTLVLTREYPPNVYGGAGVVVDELTRALSRRMAVEVRCFSEPRGELPGIVVRGYAPWERLRRGMDGPAFAGALEALSVGLAMARDPVDAQVAHAHTWYASMAGLLIRTLYGIPLVVTLHSLEPLRPWKADQLGTGYLVSTGVEQHAVESADRIIAVSEAMRGDALRHFTLDPARVVVVHNGVDLDPKVGEQGFAGTLARAGYRSAFIGKAHFSTKATFDFGPGPNDVGSSRHHLLRAVEGSLRRLGTDYIDLFQLHGFDALTPIEETLHALDDLVRAGRNRHGAKQQIGRQDGSAHAVDERLPPRIVGIGDHQQPR